MLGFSKPRGHRDRFRGHVSFRFNQGALDTIEVTAQAKSSCPAKLCHVGLRAEEMGVVSHGRNRLHIPEEETTLLLDGCLEETVLYRLLEG